MGVAPSTTSTAMLALGDALTLALVDVFGDLPSILSLEIIRPEAWAND